MDRLAHVDAQVSPGSHARRVAIIGGGWAGLAAGVELSGAGVEVSLFESARQPGGRARSVIAQGHRLDNGQHILLGAYRETLRLMRAVGVAPERHLQRRPLALHQPRDGFQLSLPRLPAPLHLAFGLTLARGCTWREKIYAIRFMKSLQARRYLLDSDISVSELLDKHKQHGALRQLMWEPLCLAAANTAPENTSAQVFANILRDSLGGGRADTDLLLPTSDLDQLFPIAAARYIEAHGGTIHRATRIKAITRDLRIDDTPFDRIILATSPRQAAPLLAVLPETAAIATQLASYTYEPIGCAYLAYGEALELPLPMLGLESAHHPHLGQWVFDRGQLGGPRGLMSFVLSANGDWDRLDDSALVRTLHCELEATLGRSLAAPVWQQVLRERRATFSCRPNLPRPTPRTPLAGLWLAGDYVYADYPGTLEGAIRSGVAAARGILCE